MVKMVIRSCADVKQKAKIGSVSACGLFLK